MLLLALLSSVVFTLGNGQQLINRRVLHNPVSGSVDWEHRRLLCLKLESNNASRVGGRDGSHFPRHGTSACAIAHTVPLEVAEVVADAVRWGNRVGGTSKLADDAPSRECIPTIVRKERADQ